MSLLHQIIDGHTESELAIITSGNNVSYGKLREHTNAAAAWLLEQGVRQGDQVVVSLVNPTNQIYFTLGLLKIGAIQSYIDPRSTATSLTNTIKKLKAGTILSDEFRPEYQGLNFLLPPSDEQLKASVPPSDLFHAVSPEDLAMLSVGSGTTGEPKLLPIKHYHLVARCRNFHENTLPGERTLILQRHTSMTYLTRAMNCLFWGGCLVEVPKMRMGASDYFELLCDAIDNLNVDHLHCTVPHAKSIVKSIADSTNVVRFPHLKSMVVGASPVGKNLRELIKKKVTQNLQINYGTNESGPILRTSTDLLKIHPESLGMPGALTQVAVVGPKGEFLGPNQNGMLVVRGPCVIEGYECDPDRTRETFINGWFLTGDIGYQTTHGDFHFLSRVDDMMIVSGFNVSPDEIEPVLEAIPGVREAAVTAFYSDVDQDLILAFIVPDEQLSEAYIIEVARHTLSWKTPHKVFFVDALPRNASGKLLRRDLLKAL